MVNRGVELRFHSRNALPLAAHAPTSLMHIVHPYCRTFCAHRPQPWPSPGA